jgi:hypothetical protein
MIIVTAALGVTLMLPLGVVAQASCQHQEVDVRLHGCNQPNTVKASLACDEGVDLAKACIAASSRYSKDYYKYELFEAVLYWGGANNNADLGDTANARRQAREALRIVTGMRDDLHAPESTKATAVQILENWQGN